MTFGMRVGAQLIFLTLVCSLCLSVEDAPKLSPKDQAWAVLREGLRDTKAAKRREAVKALSLLPGQRLAIRAARQALRDKNSDVRASAAASLGQLKAVSAVPALREALSDENISVVLAAAHALLLLKDKSAYPIYYAILMGDKKSSEGLIEGQLDRLKDPKRVAELGFQEGLGFVPFGGMGYDAYRTILRKDSAPIRAAAARFLARDPDPVSEDALIQTALTDKNEVVRQAALDALAERGDPRCIERLVLNLSEAKDPVRYRTAATIIHLSDMARKPADKAK